MKREVVIGGLVILLLTIFICEMSLLNEKNEHKIKIHDAKTHILIMQIGEFDSAKYHKWQLKYDSLDSVLKQLDN